MGRVQVTRSLASSSKFADSVARAAASEAYARLSAVVAEAEAEAKRIVTAELVTDRPPLRRKKGAARLLNGIQVVLETPNGPQSFPIVLVGKARGNQHKIGALEFGSPPHGIDAVNAPFLVFPSSGDARSSKRGADGGIIRLESGGRSQRQTKQGFANNNRLSRQKLVRTTHVEHPGNRPYGFLRRGMERAVKAALR